MVAVAVFPSLIIPGLTASTLYMTFQASIFRVDLGGKVARVVVGGLVVTVSAR